MEIENSLPKFILEKIQVYDFTEFPNAPKTLKETVRNVCFVSILLKLRKTGAFSNNNNNYNNNNNSNNNNNNNNFINKIPRKTNLIYNICSTTFRTIIIIIIYNNVTKFFF